MINGDVRITIIDTFPNTVIHPLVESENLYLQFEFIRGATFSVEPDPSEYEGRFLTG